MGVARACGNASAILGARANHPIPNEQHSIPPLRCSRLRRSASPGHLHIADFPVSGFEYRLLRPNKGRRTYGEPRSRLHRTADVKPQFQATYSDEACFSR